MMTFTMQTRAAAPVEEVWKLLHDPASFPRWWSGTETVTPGPDGGFTRWPIGYPDFPMPQRLEESGADHRVTISCLVSSMSFVWQLTPDGEEAVIDAYVEIPENEVHRLDAQRAIVGESLANLAALAAASR